MVPSCVCCRSALRLLLLKATHHFVVWWSAEQVYPGKVFTKYAVLGDDVLITDKKVGSLYAYAQVIEKLGLCLSINIFIKILNLFNWMYQVCQAF